MSKEASDSLEAFLYGCVKGVIFVLIKRTWTRYIKKIYTRYYYTGYFLFGFIPIFIDRKAEREV